MAHFGDYQNEIYFAGLSGRQPRFPMSFKELEAKAHATLPKSVVSYVAGGCGNERTQDANVTAFDRWGLMPRMFVGAAQRKTPVLFDLGVRAGSDVVKALALGAAAVGIGRPYAYGLALGGVEGIVHVLRCLLAEADLLMAVDGYPRLADLQPEALLRV